ncbi:hypothetical protein QBC42DRAFT_303833 [Cladorrhinum samala]|uniref:Peroxisomal trans-2-enoyl-CoA reductase n=1 Tax=Cladorrhinum samala TaxID=585594 RepID=A0AAV9HZ02_9PEZI|nr:hypothetical protein QBC42DRAFT_303833 [Cladorrhinum samala]
MDSTEDFSPYRQDGKLYGFVCVVTGASQPVGQAIIEELAACDSPPSLKSFNASLDSISTVHPNTKIVPYPFSTTTEDSTLALIDEILASFGRLDVWVCNSALLGPASIYDTSPQDLIKCFEAHALAPFFALKHAPAAMGKLTERGTYPNAVGKQQRYGSIVVMGSVAGTYGGCWGPSYTMAAHAALGVVRSGVAVLKGTGVRVNCVSVGQVDVGVELQGNDVKGMNSQFPPASLQEKDAQQKTIGLERAGRPQEVARVAGFLASGFSSYITGANLVVDGGASVPVYSASSEADVTATCNAYSLSYLEFTHLRDKSASSKALAYCPYSKFRVGCALLTKGGEYVTGANIENASYPVTTCAERVTLGKAVVEGYHHQNNDNSNDGKGGGFKAIAVATDISPPASPCGMCRQFIREFCDLETPIIMFDGQDGYSVLKLKELLPLSFGPEALGAPDPNKPAQ